MIDGRNFLLLLVPKLELQIGSTLGETKITGDWVEFSDFWEAVVVDVLETSGDIFVTIFAERIFISVDKLSNILQRIV